MKDRLIELLLQSDPIKERDLDDDWGDGELEEIADYLLANGVIVPPTRCKDCTYLRESEKTNRMFCTYHGDSYEFETMPDHYCSEGVGMVKGV